MKTWKKVLGYANDYHLNAFKDAGERKLYFRMYIKRKRHRSCVTLMTDDARLRIVPCVMNYRDIEDARLLSSLACYPDLFAIDIK
ncbi:hypothetical protein TNCV_4737171 [Trichonephila clavipes]|nr:hypothetical protein TNCV_4737171 [Trichonephila clavipes]